MTVKSAAADSGDAKSSARERLLDATSELLAGTDTLNVPISEISRLSGLNHGLVRYYFGGKQGLMLAVLERYASQSLAALEQLVRKDVRGVTKLDLHIRGVIDTYFRFPYINRLINSLQSSSPENAAELSRIFILPLQAYQKQILEQAQQEGDIRWLDPLLFYYSVIGCCDFLFHARNTLPYVSAYQDIGPELKQAYADHVVRLLIDGARVHPDESGLG